MSMLHAPALDSAAAGVAFLRFSQISSLLKCPVIGVCLDMEEQRTLVRKAGVCVSSAQDFDIHEILVNMSDESTLLARQANGLLRKKYELKAAPLRRLDMLAFVRHWDEAFASGAYAAELWAAATRADVPLAVQRHIFGCVHMDMHEALGRRPQWQEQIRHARQERTLMAEKLRALKAGLGQAQKEGQELRRQCATLQHHKEKLRKENALLRERLSAGDAASGAGGQASEPAARAMFLERSLKEARTRAQVAEKALAQAQEERDVQRALVQHMQEEVQALLAPAQPCADCAEQCACGAQPCADCAEQCASCDTPCTACGCPRRILMVGGMTRLEALYRHAVEAKGHQFEYHDGYLNGVNTLESSLQKADIVLCPVSCNSHRACLLVKNLCKKYKKTVHMMPSYSLSAVAKVLARADDEPKASAH